MKDYVYTIVTDRIPARKELLESSIDILRLMKKLEHLKAMKKERRMVQGKLHQAVTTMRTSLRQSQHFFPRIEPEKPRQKKVSKPVEDSPISPLEQELAEIRQKLNQLM